MCLYNNPHSVEKLLKTKRNSFYAYKVVRCPNNKAVISWWQAYYIWHGGYNKAILLGTEVCSTKTDIIHNGIHVYVTRDKARHARKYTYHFSSYAKILRVKCYKKDLLGADLLNGEAVFKKVYVSKADLDAARGTTKR